MRLRDGVAAVSFDDHDRCRRCGTDDTASHTTAECDRMTGECPNCRPGVTCAACLGEGTAPCPLHPPRHAPYGIEATADADALREALDALTPSSVVVAGDVHVAFVEAAGDGWHPPCFDPASIAAAEREVFTAIVGNPASEADPPRSGRVLAELHRDLVGRCR